MPVTALPLVDYEGQLWFFDRRLQQIRTVRPPLEFRDLNEFEMSYFEDLVARGATRELPQ